MGVRNGGQCVLALLKHGLATGRVTTIAKVLTRRNLGVSTVGHLAKHVPLSRQGTGMQTYVRFSIHNAPHRERRVRRTLVGLDDSLRVSFSFRLSGVCQHVQHLVYFSVSSALVRARYVSRLTRHTNINSRMQRVARHTVHKRVSFVRDFARQITLLGKLSRDMVGRVTRGLPVARNIRHLVFILGECNCGVTVLSNKFACFNGCLGSGFNVSCMCTGRLRVMGNGLAKECLKSMISKGHGTRLLGLVTRMRHISVTRAVTMKSKTGSLPVLSRTNLNVTFRTGPGMITGTRRSVGAVKLSNILCFLNFGSSCLRRHNGLWEGGWLCV